MKTKILAGIIIIAVLFCFVGCDTSSNYYTYKSIENQNGHSFNMRYEKFDGTREYKIKVSEGEELAVKVDVKTSGGSLSVSIAKKGQEPVYTGNSVPTGSFTVYLKEAGTYIVSLTAAEHVGSYSFDWGE